MDRYTRKDDNGRNTIGWSLNDVIYDGLCYGHAVDRLSDYEDIAELVCGVDRLRELAKADKDGKVVILPCKVGDTVYEIWEDGSIHDAIITGVEIIFASLTDGDPFPLEFVPEAIGKSVWLTREAAAATMKERENNG